MASRSQGSAKGVAVYAAYAAAYLALRELEGPWSNGQFSLWRPEAGLCFAFLWHCGPSRAIAVASVGLAAELVAQRLGLLAADPGLMAFSVIQPICFGAVIWLVSRLGRDWDAVRDIAALPLGLSALFAPLAASAAMVPIELLRTDRPDPGAVWTAMNIGIGSLLGLFLVAPALLALARDPQATKLRAALKGISTAAWVEVAAALAAGLLMIPAFYATGSGVHPAALLLALAWIGFRFGRTLAVLATMAGAAPVLWLTARSGDFGEMLPAHLTLAAAAILACVVGGITDSLRSLRRQQAPRGSDGDTGRPRTELPTMSRAAIHELAQPLSILVMEGARLARRPDSAPVADGIAVINRATNQLREALERYRQLAEVTQPLGDRIALRRLLDQAVAIATSEDGEAGKALALREDLEAIVEGNPADPTEEILDLLRRAMKQSARPHFSLYGRPDQEGFVAEQVPSGAVAGRSEDLQILDPDVRDEPKRETKLFATRLPMASRDA